MKNKIIFIISLSVAIIIFIIVLIILSLNSTETDKNIKVGNMNNISIDSRKEYKISTYVTEKIKEKSETVRVNAILTEDMKAENLKNVAENIAIVRIISLESSSAEYNSAVGMTYGKLLINTTIKGRLKEGAVIDYAATGGFLTISEWEKYQPKAANEKRDYLRAQSGVKINKDKTYIHLQFADAIDVEEGKTYLAYLNYEEGMQKYQIIGFGNGLMELDIDKENSTISKIDLDTKKLKIKNNNNKQYENLDNYIAKNIGLK